MQGRPAGVGRAPETGYNFFATPLALPDRRPIPAGSPGGEVRGGRGRLRRAMHGSWGAKRLVGKHVRLLFKPFLATPVMADCTKCSVSCQSACKTSLTVGNQSCTAPEKQRRTHVG